MEEKKHCVTIIKCEKKVVIFYGDFLKTDIEWIKHLVCKLWWYLYFKNEIRNKIDWAPMD